MMRSVLAGMVILAGSSMAPCQEPFVVHTDTVQAGYDAAGTSVRETTDGFVVFGHQNSSDGTGQVRASVYKFGPDGAYLDRYEIGTGEELGSYLGLFDPVARKTDGSFVSPIIHSNGYGYSLALAHFDGGGDLLSSTGIMGSPPEDSVIVAPRQLRLTLDGGLILCGFRDPPDAYAQALLIKLDSNYALQWQRTYSAAGQAYEAISVAQYSDGGYVLAGYRLPASLVNLGFLIRTDSVGNQIWRRHFGNESGAWGAVRVGQDGGIITFSSYAEQTWPWDWRQQLLTKWNADGGIVWQTHSSYAYNVTAYDLEILADQSIVTSGPYYSQALLTKYSAEGDSLWARQYGVFDNALVHLPYDVEPSSDGGFLLTGTASQNTGDPHPGQETIFVIKSDSLGCVVPGCQNVGVQEYAIDLQERLRVSPNPASEVVSIALDLPEGGEVQGQVQAQLLDAAGRLVLQSAVQQNLNKLSATLDVSALPAGTYYLHVRDAKRWLAGSKVVVE